MSSGIDGLPGADDLAESLRQVTGDPQAIRSTATAWRTAGGHATSAVKSLSSAVGEVNNSWQGNSANAFEKYMAGYPVAAGGLQDVLSACADALDKAAFALEDAHGRISLLQQDAIDRAAEYRREYARLNPDSTVDEREKALAGSRIVSGNATAAGKIVKTAAGVLSDTMTTLTTQIGTGKDGGLKFFGALRRPDGPDFEPGEHVPDWQRTPDAAPSTTLASTDGSDGGGAPSGQGYSYVGGVSSAGNTPAPKPQVVEWIKEALREIRSGTPEVTEALKHMNRHMLDRIKELDPDDPRTIDRIWTVIYHESSGNPSAINNTDVNARNGVPSQGLMQVIPPNFDTYSLPGHKQILEPVDNIIAGVLYTEGRYGSLAKHPGIVSMESPSHGPYLPY